MATESSPGEPTVEFLRVLAAEQGVFPEEQDLEGVLAFLRVILPVLADVERRLPPETPLA